MSLGSHDQTHDYPERGWQALTPASPAGKPEQRLAQPLLALQERRGLLIRCVVNLSLKHLLFQSLTAAQLTLCPDCAQTPEG